MAFQTVFKRYELKKKYQKVVYRRRLPLREADAMAWVCHENSCAFDDIFAEYTKKNELVKVKTTNMGSMFRLTYNVTLRDATKEKEMIDRIRERNGNLEIMVSKQENRAAEL